MQIFRLDTIKDAIHIKWGENVRGEKQTKEYIARPVPLSIDFNSVIVSRLIFRLSLYVHHAFPLLLHLLGTRAEGQSAAL